MARRKTRPAASKSPSSLNRSKRTSRRTNALSTRGKDNVRFDGKHRKSSKKPSKIYSTFRKSAQNTKIKSKKKRSTGTGKSSKGPRKLNVEKNKMVKKDLIIPGSEIRNMITEELRNRNRSDIAASYDGQKPISARIDTGEDTDSTAPSLGNVTTPKTDIIHDKSKYGGAEST
jgi:hypothetical protein